MLLIPFLLFSRISRFKFEFLSLKETHFLRLTNRNLYKFVDETCFFALNKCPSYCIKKYGKSKRFISSFCKEGGTSCEKPSAALILSLVHEQPFVNLKFDKEFIISLVKKLGTCIFVITIPHTSSNKINCIELSFECDSQLSKSLSIFIDTTAYLKIEYLVVNGSWKHMDNFNVNIKINGYVRIFESNMKNMNLEFDLDIPGMRRYITLDAKMYIKLIGNLSNCRILDKLGFFGPYQTDAPLFYVSGQNKKMNCQDLLEFLKKFLKDSNNLFS